MMGPTCEMSADRPPLPWTDELVKPSCVAVSELHWDDTACVVW